jgi:hypothetical protein
LAFLGQGRRGGQVPWNSRSSESGTGEGWLCLTRLELLVTFGAMRSMRSRALYRTGFAVWLLLTTLVCLNPDEAGPHLYGAHEGPSDQHPTKAESFDSSRVTSVPGQACDDEILGTVPPKFFQDTTAPLQVVAPGTTADVAHDGSWLTARIVRVSDSPPGDLSRIVPLRI